MSSEPLQEPQPQQPAIITHWDVLLAEHIASLKPLEIPDFSIYTTGALFSYIETEVRYYSIDVNSSRIIKEAMGPVVLNRIRRLIIEDIDANIGEILDLSRIYGFTRTGIVFNPSFDGVQHIFSTEELRESIINFYTADENLIPFDKFAPMIGYITLYQRRLDEKAARERREAKLKTNNPPEA